MLKDGPASVSNTSFPARDTFTIIIVACSIPKGLRLSPLSAFDCTNRFGYLYDEFSTFRASLITQFALLIGDSSPDYSKDSLMCIYIVSFVFICTLSLLNFLLAIVVNGEWNASELAGSVTVMRVSVLQTAQSRH